MPDNIRQFKTPELGLQPTEIGVEATAAAARRGGAFFHEAAQDISATGQRYGSAIRDAGQVAVDYETHREIAAGSRDLAARINNLTQQWDDTRKNVKDPNDTSVAPKFREDVLEPELESFTGNFHTEKAQQWAQGHVATLRQHMFEKTTADMSTMAGEAAAVNHRQTVNFLSNTVRNDPSSLQFSLDTLKSSTEATINSSPNITASAAAKMRTELLQAGSEEIIKTAALGYIEKTGVVPAWASDPKFAPFIKGAELKQLAQAARYYQRLGESETRSQRADLEHAQRKDFNKQVNDLELSTMPKNAGDPPTLPANYWQKLRELGTHPGAELEPGRLKTMIMAGEALTTRLNKPEPLGPVSHTTTMDLLKRIRAADQSKLTDNSEIYKAYEDGKLNHADFNFLTSEFNNLRTPEGMALEKDRTNFVKSYARLVDGMMNQAGEHSLLGTQKMYEFEMDARRQEATLRQQGKDPHLVYDPRSPEFWGRPENLARYRVSLQEAQRYEKDLKTMEAEKFKNDEAAAKVSPATAFAPPRDWLWSPSRRQYRDTEGNVYDDHGKPIKAKK